MDKAQWMTVLGTVGAGLGFVLAAISGGQIDVPPWVNPRSLHPQQGHVYRDPMKSSARNARSSSVNRLGKDVFSCQTMVFAN